MGSGRSSRRRRSGVGPWSPAGGRPGAAPRSSTRRGAAEFASGLLLIGSALPEGLRLRVTGDVVSSSYVDMTIDTLRSLGGRVARRGPADFEVVPTRLTARAYAVEGDHSAASYFLAAPAVIGAGTVRVDGLRPDSRQPDAMLGRLLETRGARVGRGATWVEVQARGPVEAFGRFRCEGWT